MRCRGEHHSVPMCPALSRLASGRRFGCLRSPSCAGDGVRGLVAPFLRTVCLDALEQLREEGLVDERDAGAGGSPHAWDERRRSLWGAVQIRACRVRPGERKLSQMSLWVFVAFC